VRAVRPRGGWGTHQKDFGAVIAGCEMSNFHSFFLPIAVSKDKIEYRCVRWTWTGDVYNRKVVCLEWKKVEGK